MGGKESEKQKEKAECGVDLSLEKKIEHSRSPRGLTTVPSVFVGPSGKKIVNTRSEQDDVSNVKTKETELESRGNEEDKRVMSVRRRMQEQRKSIDSDSSHSNRAQNIEKSSGDSIVAPMEQ